MAKKYCNQCGVTHTSIMCFNKPRAPLKNKKLKHRVTPRQAKDIEFKNDWIQQHPPDHAGYWYCYLRISPLCPNILTMATLTLEHVIPKGKGIKYRYDHNNVKPACEFCNVLKGSQTLEALSMKYPNLQTEVNDGNS